MNENKGLWIGIVIVVILGILGLWWISASKTPAAPAQDNTQATSTDTSNTTGQTGGKVATRVNQTSSSVVAVVDGLSGVSQFKSLFHSSGVASQVSASSTAKYTIFVPKDSAFARVPKGTLSTSASVIRFVQYHVVVGRAVDVDALLAGSIQAMSKDALNFSYGQDKVPMVDSAAVVAQYNAKNGVVYVIDEVLLPPNKTQ